MSDKFLKYTVIFLAILIIICFIFLLYGLYSKISNPQNVSGIKISNYSLKLDSEEKIIDVKIIDKNKILAFVTNKRKTYK